MNKDPDFIALLKYKTTEEGGRKTIVHSGYRPDIKFPFSKILTCGFQNFIGQGEVFPGENVKAEITIIATKYFIGQLYENLEFDFREGRHNIGTGKIIEIINNNLKKTKNEKYNFTYYFIKFIFKLFFKKKQLTK
jgi:translation elongation factor EF-Tu-like GTPase